MLNITLPPELEKAIAEEATHKGTSAELLMIDALQVRFLKPSSEKRLPEGATLADALSDYIGAINTRDKYPDGSTLSEKHRARFRSTDGGKAEAGQVVMLTDTGPLIALLDQNDRHHASCVAIARNLPRQPLETTWLCFTEAIYFLGEEGGYALQERLWQLRRNGRLSLLEFTPADGDRIDALMSQYRDVPMDAADASLVAVAESRGYRQLFTIDSDFYIYPLADGSVLEVVR